MNKNKFKVRFADAFIILIFSVISIVCINKYRYGIEDHCIVIPYVKFFINNSLYHNDYLLLQRHYYYTYLWNLLGLIVGNININLHTLFFICYLIFLYAIFLGIYVIAITLFRKREVALLSLYFFLFSKPILGGIVTLDNIFLTRFAVLPFLLFSIYFFFKEKYLCSFSLLGIGFLIHPISSIFAFILIFFASIFELKKIGIKRFLLSIIIFVIIISPILKWKILCSPESSMSFFADPLWVSLIKFRSSHHVFPFSWWWGSFFRAGLLLYIFILSWKHRPSSEYHKIVLCFSATIFFMCIIGTIFTEIFPLPIIIQFQLFRSFKFIVYFAMIYFANYFYSEMQSRVNLFDKLLVAFASLGIFYDAKYWEFAFVGFLLISVFLILIKNVIRKDTLFKYYISAILVVVIVLGSTSYLIRGGLLISNAQEKNWLDVQFWAKENTGINDIFIVPPMRSLQGFRIESERTIYGDFKDGTLSNFNPAFGYEWFSRMKKLGYKEGHSFEEGFKNLSNKDFMNIADEIVQDSIEKNKVFLVWFNNYKILDFPVVYKNKKYTVYDVQ